MHGSTQYLQGAYKITHHSTRLSPWQRIPLPLQSANASPCTPVKTDVWLSGGAGRVVNVPQSLVGSENILSPRGHEGLGCRAILVGPVGTDQGSVRKCWLPSASAGPVSSAAQETALALAFEANMGFCFQKQITLSLGISVSHSYLNKTGSLCFFTLVLKWAFGLFFWMLDALVKSTSLIFF